MFEITNNGIIVKTKIEIKRFWNCHKLICSFGTISKSVNDISEWIYRNGLWNAFYVTIIMAS